MINKAFKYLKRRHRIPFWGVLCLIIFYASGQTYLSSKTNGLFEVDFSKVPMTDIPTPIQNVDSVSKPKNTEPVLILVNHANRLVQTRGSDTKILIDSVIFEHNGALLFCDSAYYNEKSNTFDAYSNVRMEQGDTLFLYADYIHYEGNTNMAIARYNVRLENTQATLYTDSLNYDRTKNIGYYFDGGLLEDEQNKLTSYWGQYEPGRNLAVFIDSVIVINNKFKLYSDTLNYNTRTKILDIVSKTKIVSDSGTIYSSRGWYNTVTEQSVLLDQSTVINNLGDKILRGDSLIYNRKKGYGEIFGNMFLQDTAKKVILCGHYGYYNELTEYALATDSAYSIEYSQGDSLYLHADTLKLVPDSIYHIMKIYHGVRFYRKDLQGVCDSMQFSSRDSILHLYGDPVLWSEGKQISGDTIDIFMNDSTIDYVHVKGYSFSIEQKDSLRFNQVKGRSLKAYMGEKKKIKRILVEGNVESIFYPEEDNGNSIGLNWLESSFLEMTFDEGRFSKMKAWPKTVGKMTPIDDIQEPQRRLSEFYWFDYLRPLDKDDIFRNVRKKESDIKPKRNNLFDSPDFE